MSSIGKIFVIINLVLSVLVLGAAGALLKKTDATKDQVRIAESERDASKAELDQARSEFTEREKALNSDKQQLTEEKNDLDVRAQSLDNNVARLEADNQSLRNDVSKINASLAAIQASFSTTQQRVVELTDQNTQLNQQMIDAKTKANEAANAQGAAEETLAQAQAQLEELQLQLTASQEEASTNKKLVEVAKSAGFDVTTIIAMPRIEATVAEVDDQYGFVVLDKGKKDNVERGFTFEIHRDGNYLGRVKVDEIYDDYATARIELKAPGAKMQRFDHASTYLN
jgi:predicted  nucleic acid-binding Zn-ribbon protein